MMNGWHSPKSYRRMPIARPPTIGYGVLLAVAAKKLRGGIVKQASKVYLVYPSSPRGPPAGN
jgi:hypothetical protein